MSGPKSYGYRVDTAALERAREQRALLDSIARLQARHAELSAEAKRARDAYGDEIAAIVPLAATPAQGSLDQIRAAERELSERVAYEQAQLQQQTALVTRSLVSSGVALVLDEKVDDIADVLAQRPSERPRQDDEDAQSQARRLLARLDSRSPEDLENVRRAAATALVAEGSRAALAIESLRVAIRTANEREAARRSVRLRVEALEARLDGLDPAICLPARETLSSAHNRELGEEALGNLERLVERTVATAREADERMYVVDQLERAFADLGYEVSNGFATAIVEDGFVDIAKMQDAWAGYAVRVRLPSDGGRIALNVVRGEAWRPDQAAHDAEMESAFCEDVPEIQRSLEGVELEARRLTAPGEVPMQVVDIPAPSVRRHVSHEREQQL